MKNEKTSFSAVVTLPYHNEEVVIDVDLDKDEEHLTYDEVEDAIYDKIQLKYNLPDRSIPIDELNDEDYPNIVDIVINVNGESYPVISESMNEKKKQLKKDKAYEKYLVLPEATYALTPECKLWMNMMDKGLLDRNAEFDYDKMHQILESMK